MSATHLAEGPEKVPGAVLPLGAAPRAERVRTMIDLYFDFIWRSLRRLGVPRADADDAAQQVFWIASRAGRRSRRPTLKALLAATRGRS